MEKNILKTVSLHTISEMICLHFSVFSTILKRLFFMLKKNITKDKGLQHHISNKSNLRTSAVSFTVTALHFMCGN
jgi:regulator of PEP synthase PpsR (kinase-PPPase family)